MTHKDSKTIFNTLSGIVILLLIFFFYTVCYQYTYNFFYQDDYHLLRFVTLFQDSTLSIQEKLKALWDLHNEHRIIIPRLFVLLDYYLQGHLDWQILNTIAALYYLGIFGFLCLIIKKVKMPQWYMLPIALFIFQPSSYENFYWTISILQQVGNLFWAIFLFYSIIYFQKKHFWITIIIALILTFTHGNGLFAFGVGVLILFFQKRFKALSIWLIVMTITAMLYFWGYYTAQNSNIIGSLEKPLQLIGCFGGFWGNFIRDFSKNSPKIGVAILGGLLIFGSLLTLNLSFVINFFSKQKENVNTNKYSQERLFLLAIFLFLSITSGLVALSRSWSSIQAGFQNRYLHNSVIAFVLLYLSMLLFLKSKKSIQLTAIAFLGLGVMYNVFSWYSNFELLAFQKKSQEADAVNYKLNGISIINDKSFNQNITETLKESFDTGVSVFPESKLYDAIKNLDALKGKHNLELPIDIQKDSSLTFNIANSRYRNIYHFQNYNLPFKGEVYLIFKSDKNIFISATSHRKNAKKNFLKTGQFFTDGFFSSIMTDAMPANEYVIGILQKNNNHFIYFPTKYKILNH